MESAKSRGLCGVCGLRGCVVCVGPWVRELRVSNLYVGCVGQIFFRGSNLRGSKFFTWVQNFCVGQFLFALVNF